MDGVASGGGAGDSSKLVMVLATTNCPWDLDEAMRRRLEKRIYIALPDEASRRDMLRVHLQTVTLDASVDLDAIARRMEGYSGADIKIVCRDASMMPMRRLVSQKSPVEIKALKDAGALEVGLCMADFQDAMRNTSPSVSGADCERFVLWDKEFSSF